MAQKKFSELDVKVSLSPTELFVGYTPGGANWRADGYVLTSMIGATLNTVKQSQQIDAAGAAAGRSYLISVDAGYSAYWQAYIAGVIRWGWGSASTGEWVLRRYDAAGALQDSPISVDPTTGAATIAHPLTTNSQVINGVGAAATRELSLNVDSGYSSSIRWRTAASLRWSLSKTSTAESGSNAGSNVSLARFDDAGALLGTPITVARNTGLMTVAEGLAVSGNGGAASGFTSLGVSSTTTTAPVNIDSIAGQFAITRYRTGVLTRWDAGKETTAEGGSNAGSDYTLRAFTDAGTLRAIALKISRANGDATFEAKGTFGGLVSGAAGFQSGSVTIGTIPSASLFPRTSIYCSDLGGGGGHISSDGTAWRRERSDSYEVRSTDAGAAFTYTHLTSAQTQRLTAGITAARTVTLTAGAPSGVRARFIRDAAATGAFNWAIGGLKNLTAGTWCEIESDGTNWFLAEYGSL